MKAIVFPGQGSQRFGMGRDFCDEYSDARRVFEEGSEAIGVDLKQLCFEENNQLGLTEYTQPAILTTELAMYRSIKENYGLSGDRFAGHSLGEVTALVAAGVIRFADGVKIVRKRGSLMQRAVPRGKGGMLALIHDSIEDTAYEETVKECGAEVANMNSRKQVVVSGEKAALSRLRSELEKKFPDMRVVELDVSAPFHSSLLREIESEYEEYLKEFSDHFDTKNCGKVISNFTGGLYSPDQLITNLVQQVSNKVRWVENMKLIAAACKHIYEIGPNKPLTAFFATIDVKVSSIVSLKALRRLFDGHEYAPA